MSWPPKPSQLTKEEINLPDEARVSLATLLTGNSKYPEDCQLIWAGHGIWSDLRPKEASRTHITTLCHQDPDK